MNNSRKPRQGVSPDSVSNKKTGQKSPRKTGVKTPRKKSYRVPAGLNIPGLRGGTFTNPESWNVLVAPRLQEIKQQKLKERRARDAQHRKETRAQRSEKLAKADGENVSKKEMTKFQRAKGMRSDTGKLHEKTRYRWYGVFKVQGTESQVRKAAQTAGSDPRRIKPQQQPDGSWSVMVARFFQHGTPKAALGDGENPGFIPAHVEQAFSEFQNDGASSVHYAGAVWQAIPSKKGGK